jgi:diaminopimelate epimerase
MDRVDGDMRVPFAKMEGAGNDFVVLDARSTDLQLSAAACARLADRRFGVGCDQVLVIEAPHARGHTAHYRIFNADGSEAEQCGNGVRCVARWLADHGVSSRTMVLGSLGGPVEVELQADGLVRVDMGPPRFAPRQVPFDADEQAPRYAIQVLGENRHIGVLSMGNPHAVLEVEDVSHAPLATVGPALEHHERFPQRTNVGFMQRLGRDRIRLRVHERGVGETLACGTGACAAAVWGQVIGVLDQRVSVELPGGSLVIEWRGADGPVYMTGPATQVFTGEIELP